MSYQVLARKWRPKSFATLVGQEHVVRALSHALATGRLHHAWLFTGTRGVGKTTISRILAKALNCETGVTAEPCNQCAACQAIDADRFPDYVEMDAASNRGVEDMAALLDQAVYAPVQGRYKVYMIDEVHMLTGHAFNAMLKTLEEPPEHVKFILATTDPQKIPVTVLSRCLQFNLKQMPQGHIIEHLSRILEAEVIPFEVPALRHLAKAANGSMRDALSLLDQAIAHGSGKVEEEQVTHMLGTVGDDHLYAVLDALAAGDVTALLGVADRMEARSLSFDAALQALASLLHRVALAQFAPAAIADEAERQRVLPHTEAFDAEFLQLAYQIAIHGRDELPLAPDDYAGFTMTLLRLHAFRPDQPPALGSPAAEGGGGGVARSLPPAAPRPAAMPRPAPANAGAPPVQAAAAAPAAPLTPAPSAVSTPTPPAPVPAAERVQRTAPAPASAPAETRPEPANSVPPWEDLPPEAFVGQSSEPATVRSESPREDAQPPAAVRPAPVVLPEQAAPAAPAPEAPLASPAPPIAAVAPAPGGDDDAAADFAAGNWHGLIRRLGLGGLVREFAQHCEWLGFADGVIELRLSNAHRHLLDMNPGVVERIQDQLASLYGAPLKLRAAVGAIEGETPAQRDEADRRVRHAEAVAALESDPFVRELIERFDATLVEASVKPL
ncbi:DNA polymerase III gamma/tau subunit [Azoarcus sp. CIB]|uniref:DNA polymerase III subunit gamma/tau n=1 Tax=Aromatoleum sp. (strain CIB) TaxID=198107 RepID=UPI00067A8B5B|nr:DNA polymerase III subunit gamma/tau [Azoarcus sp. CIB]AKU10658.1 DNA polymerase III gamma/tau subunit [Azoarcus sp. CIB]